MIPTSRLGTCLVSHHIAMGKTLCYLINVWNGNQLENTHVVWPGWAWMWLRTDKSLMALTFELKKKHLCPLPDPAKMTEFVYFLLIEFNYKKMQWTLEDIKSMFIKLDGSSCARDHSIDMNFKSTKMKIISKKIENEYPNYNDMVFKLFQVVITWP